jgi:hypothetical protein
MACVKAVPSWDAGVVVNPASIDDGVWFPWAACLSRFCCQYGGRCPARLLTAGVLAAGLVWGGAGADIEHVSFRGFSKCIGHWSLVRLVFSYPPHIP